MHVDVGEHLGIDLGALGREFDRTAEHRMAAALQDQHHVISGTAAGASQHGLQRARRQVQAAVVRLVSIRRAVHHQRVATAGFGHKPHAGTRTKRPGPAHSAFHFLPFKKSLYCHTRSQKIIFYAIGAKSSRATRTPPTA